MKKQVIFIHGGDSFNSDEDFLSYLRSVELREPVMQGKRQNRWPDTLYRDLGDGFEIYAPSMPNKDNSRFEEWKVWFERHFEYIRNGAVLIGWSQGGSFLAKYLTENNPPFTIFSLYLVAAPFGSVDWHGENGADFTFESEQLLEVGKKVENITLFHSKDDPIVPYEHALKYKEALPDAELVTFEDRNHFLQEEFPELIAHIQGK